tara:strand:- start:1240 stop:2841 length:1602 start_codon:yes stop_codon:yes gene_type:complete
MSERPNILLIMNDDMGYSDIGCYGGEVQTPNLDRLAAGGVRFTQFYNTARCCPTRASILTGLHPHQASVGHMVADLDEDGYRGDLNERCVTIAEALKPAGYATYMSGKWHVTRHTRADGPKHSWPRQRGFDRFYGIITGAANYYQPKTLTDENDPVDMDALPEDYFLTDAISDRAVTYIEEHAAQKTDAPFFLYTAYTAPHWPLHAHEEDIAKYAGRFDAGWDQLREERLQRMRDMGLLDTAWPLTPRDPTQPPWTDAPNKDWEARRMEVYAAQIDRMDQGIGRIIAALEATGAIDNTLILFLADNGACAEEIDFEQWVERGTFLAGTTHTRQGTPVRMNNRPDIMPGAEDTYQSYGVPWANLSNTPFREYKHWVHEGGIATPLIAHWPAGVEAKGVLRDQPGQLPDIMATCLDAAGASYPATYSGNDVQPLEGTSLKPIFDGDDNGKQALVWEHEGNRAVRKDNWKLVCKYPGDWELYDIVANRTETDDVAARHPEVVAELSAIYDDWAERCGVAPWSRMLTIMREKAARAR